MGNIDYGTQKRNVNYFDNVDDIVVNDRLRGLIPTGIYSGGYLTRVNDTTVSVSTLVCEIGDADHQQRIETTASVNITVGSSTTYVVLRWVYAEVTDNYMDILAVASPSANDLIVGKCNYSGSTLLTTFDYSLRTVPNVLVKNLLVEPTATASMQVRIRAGKISFGNTTADIYDQLSPTFSTSGLTTGQSRIDVIVSDTNGSISVLAGTPATTGSQVAPSYGTYIALAEITISFGQTTITSSSIRVVSNAARFSGNAVLLTGDQTVAGVKNFGGGLVIETRTSDPVSPATGRIWMRTDIS